MVGGRHLLATVVFGDDDIDRLDRFSQRSGFVQNSEWYGRALGNRAAFVDLRDGRTPPLLDVAIGLAEDSAAPFPVRTMPTARDPANYQSGLLTADYILDHFDARPIGVGKGDWVVHASAALYAGGPTAASSAPRGSG